jgi:hypothetical protein
MKKQTKTEIAAETVTAKRRITGGAEKPPATKPPKAKKDGKQGEPGAVAPKADGKYPRDPRNPFRAGSAYAIAFDILAAHPDGFPKKEWIPLLAEAMGKAEKLAGFNVQVLLSAKPNANGIDSNTSPRHRACRPGFYITRDGDTVKLAVDSP